MIKINLLPYQKAVKVKRQQSLEAQLLIAGLVFLVVIAGLFFFGYMLNAKITEQQTLRDSKNQQLEMLKKKVKEVQDVEAKKQLVEQKIAIIDQLKRNQQGPVHVLDEVSRHLPSRIWLTSLVEKGNVVDIDGRATTNFDIVDYFNSLKSSPYISNLELVESRQGNEGPLTIYNFKLRFTFKT